MVNRVSSYFPKGGHLATETELKIILGVGHFIKIVTVCLSKLNKHPTNYLLSNLN